MDLKELLKSTYRDKKVLVTGHTGFKGAWLCQVLKMAGAQIKGYALDPEHDNDLYNLLNIKSYADSVIGDIMDAKKFGEEILNFQPDFIFHLAAQPLVRLSYEIPVETFAVNSIGTANLLNSVRALNKECKLILITTDKVYENKEWVYPYRENDRLGGYDPYSASKACAEIVINSFRQSFFNPNDYHLHKKSIASTRAGNVIGGGDWSKDRIIPDIVKALQKDDPIKIRNPKAVRPWQHVLEPLTGYLLLGARMVENPVKFADSFNFGPFIEDTRTVHELVEIAISKWGKGTFEHLQLTNAVHEAGLLKLDINKAINELGWYPRLNAEKAIEFTMEWYRHFEANPVEFTESQINSYFNWKN
ncbi:MAG: CDP-glucose 4,6-dehydratase [Sporocytophaga sp.]|uniref:CDP-glucose 4,6-dehydratase n=1 Tax=Sporocytophaga sp. TaxID=2231183 RepID=UPI001B128F48|nr:CDP-glucose 4,6-dehydratase [Sporocytophaga sp.]MBO9699699.1 CDP-glucose 4,6-dehydratase [Sporocytophaga sp.]